MIGDIHAQGLNLQRYLDRIGHRRTVSASIETLSSLHKAHACAVPFENIDVQLGRDSSTDVGAAYEKIVVARRGGWCYEQNAIFGWALSEIGFDVTRIAAGVMRQDAGESSMASHLCLLARVPGSGTKYLADVGFGGSMITPVPLREARHNQTPFQLNIAKTDDDFWRFSEDTGAGLFGYDFVDEPACESHLAEKCNFLSSDPGSHFVLNLVAQRRSTDTHRTLRGRVFTTMKTSAIESRTLRSADELVSVLHEEFGLDVPEVAAIWPKITLRHRDLFGDS